MQVKNYSVFMGEDRIQSRHAAKKDAKQKRNGKAIDARGIAAATDPVAAKRAQAQKKAMKILGDAFAGESKIDDDMSERREHIDRKQEEEKKKAEATEEKKQEQEAKLEAKKEDREEQKKLTENIVEASRELNGGAKDSVAKAQQEIRDMMNRLKLVEADVKGATVDQGV